MRSTVNDLQSLASVSIPRGVEARKLANISGLPYLRIRLGLPMFKLTLLEPLLALQLSSFFCLRAVPKEA